MGADGGDSGVLSAWKAWKLGVVGVTITFLRSMHAASRDTPVIFQG